MPYSVNGKIIGICLFVLSVLFVVCADSSIDSSFIMTRRLLFGTGIIVIYNAIVFFYGYYNLDFITNISLSIGLPHFWAFFVIDVIVSILSIPSVLFFLDILFCENWVQLLGGKTNFTSKNKDDHNLNICDAGYWCAIGFSVLSLVVLVYYSFSNSVWFDETFSIGVVKHSYQEVIDITGNDVHPPLYYLMLKFFLQVITIILPFANGLYLSKLFSVIPYIVLFLVVIFFVQKHFGRDICSFMLLCICMPNILEYGVEIRMYSWGILFCFLAFYSCLLAIQSSTRKTYCYIGISVFSILAFYTHYYCCLVIAVLLIAILPNAIKNKNMKLWLLSVVTITVAYIPWIHVLLSTISSVSSRTWPEPASFRTIFNSIYFFLGPYSILPVLLPVLLYEMSLTCKAKCNSMILKAGILLPFIILVVGELVSIIVCPVFQSRYMVLTYGCFWLSISIVIMSLDNNTRSNMRMLLLVIGIIDLFVFCRHESISKQDADVFKNNICQYGDNKVIVTDEPEIAYDISAMTNYKCILVTQIGNLLSRVYSEGVFVNTNYLDDIDFESSNYCFITNKDSNGIIDSFCNKHCWEEVVNESMISIYWNVQ